MNSEQRDRVHELFELCRELPHAERTKHLDSLASSEAEIGREVRSLLEAYDHCSEFLEEPALEQHAGIVEQALQPFAGLRPGSRFGHFEIGEPLGAGGMGMVYQARDTILGREVALKLLPPSVAEDPARRARFQMEARAVAALNHPNIAAIYAVENGALVMELAPGSTLQERIEAGPIALDEAMRIAGQVAAGLEAAHERGIIHRDLKPANIKVTKEGMVKVLDFGLAKNAGVTKDSASESNPSGLTSAGMILGTTGYMAPEQAKGLPVDKRADIWSFGIVLYEMLTGERLFDGETDSDRLAAVLTKEPDLSRVPPKVRRLLELCLRKDPKRRLRDIGDWATLLEEVPTEGPARRRFTLGLPWAIAAAAGLIGFGAARMLHLLDSKPAAPEIRVDLVTPGADDRETFAISPDGSRIAFTALQNGRKSLWLRTLSSGRAQQLPGTEDASDPFWSPDSRSIGFFAELKLKRLDVGGELPQVLAPVQSIGAQGAWGAGDVILFSPGVTPLSRVSASGGAVTLATKLAPGQINQFAPRFLQDGRHFLYVVNGSDPSIWMASLDGDAPRRVASITVGADSEAEAIAPGWLARVRQSTLVAQRFDINTGQFSGDPIPLERSVRIDTATMAGAFSASAAGTVVWKNGASDQKQLMWFNRSGEKLGTFGSVGDSNFHCVELSPDGTRAATMIGPPGSADIWLQDSLRNIRFTLNPTDERYATWSPDGSRILFASNRNGEYDLYQRSLHGAAQDQLILHSSEFKRPNSWSPDGNYILYWTAQNNGDLFVLPLTGDRKPFPFVSTPFHEQQGVFSPDGKWVAYQSDASGRFEIYVQPFPGPGGATQVSANGGVSPRWRADGKELYYVSPDLKMMAVKGQASGSAFVAEAPETLFQTMINPATNRQQYDVAKDGRFLILSYLSNASTEPIHLLLNWTPPR